MLEGHQIRIAMLKNALPVVMLLTLCVQVCSSTTFSSSAFFASAEKASALLTAEDEFTRRWSAFDIDARLGKPNGTRGELFDHIRMAVRAWNDEEIDQITRLIAAIDSNIANNRFVIDFPDTVFLVKTSGAEEGGAPAYTRQNAIVLSESLLSGNKSNLKRILVHELFHILSRSNPEFRRTMYDIIGFKGCNEVSYPADLEDLRITNPDAPYNDSYITVQYAGEPAHCMMILYANKPYGGGSLFQYMNIGLLRVEAVGDSMQVQYHNGQAVVFKIEEVDGFFEQTGRNTLYIIHPEEILADNFVFALLGNEDLPDPEIVRSIRKVIIK